MKKLLWILLLLMASSGVRGQQAVISCRVFSSVTAAPLAGAHVSLKGTALSAATDAQGYCSFTPAAKDVYTLLFSYMGYASDSVKVAYDGVSVKVNKTLFPATVRIATVEVTANRGEQPVQTSPSRVDVMTESEIGSMPVISTDELLMAIPGINASRSYGIYNKTGDVTMRGLNRNVHALLLMDGVPLSLLDGSASNWNRIDASNIERIEVLKGPNSSMYGGNAMAGVINIITKRPTEKLSGSAGFSYGSFNTFGGRVSLGTRSGKSDKHYAYGMLNASTRQSDGYIMTPEEQRDSTDVEMYVSEYNVGVKGGYVFQPGHLIEGEYNFSYDRRGNGSQIFETTGNYNEYNTHYARLRYSRKSAKTELSVNGFFKQENYSKLNESMKSNGLYYFLQTDAITRDYGLWCSWSARLGRYQELTVGADAKYGNTDNLDYYHTSYDTIHYDGRMGFYGLFVQDMLSLCRDRLVISAGLRGDLINFEGAGFHLYSPGLTTAFMTDYQGDFRDTLWFALSPRVGLAWNFNAKKSLYLSWSRGFRSGTLSDMCKTGDVNKGFKLANPGLSPESLDNFELGSRLRFGGKFTLEPGVYLSLGHDFQYFVGTGDSMYTTGSKLKPVIRRENIGEVMIYGAEIKTLYQPVAHWEFLLNYSYSHSSVTLYQLGTYIGKDLTGMSLIEVPDHILFGRVQWRNRFVTTVLGARYYSAEWVDDENTVRTDPYYVLDLKLYRTFLQCATVSLTIQNLLNNRFTDSKGMLNPGIFCLLDCSVRI